MIFNFTLEKGMLSISLSTDEILKDKKIKKYDKYIDLFYLVKLLNPSINFKKINFSIYPSFINDNFNKLLLLFDKKNINETIKEINEISKNYNKTRWKNN
ncbi:coagulase'like protein [Snodgrassella alvi SCGC AB-598-O02]|nr:coagulase'like protein [Snodgrassella alvi SCGC AB-598-O02]